ncbi:hypothetical protein IT402_00620 [Candidatus Nomurabacteria bacterium]|nr:hypothetical protein [Candidatus Nomurabacteria bacterium]
MKKTISSSKNTIMQTIELKMAEQETRFGISILKNEETGNLAFKTSRLSKGLCSSPDGKKLFIKITNKKNVVICIDKSGGVLIYLKKKGCWLKNPETDNFVFFEEGSLVFEEEFIHIECLENFHQKRVYILRHNLWMCVPCSDLGASNDITYFSHVEKFMHRGRPAILLKTEGGINKLSVYYLDDGTYLTIPNPPKYQENYKESSVGCTTFCNIFDNYLAIGFSNGMTTIPKYFLIWKNEQGIYKGENGTALGPEQFNPYTFFTKNIIFIPKEDIVNKYTEYETLSTKDWLPIKKYITFTVERSTFLRPEINSQGDVVAICPGIENGCAKEIVFK